MTAFMADLSVSAIPSFAVPTAYGPHPHAPHPHGQLSAARPRVAASELSAAVLRGAVVVDIRPQSARAAEGTLPGALAIDPDLLASRLDSSAPTRLSLAVDQEVEWVLVSSDGSVSAPVATALQRLGLRNVADVAGGYRALRAGGGIDAVASAQHLHREASAISAH